MTDQRHEHAAHRLRLEGIHIHYGPICALRNVSLELKCGMAVALVGANGAGKSTLMKGIVGLVPTSRGAVMWRGRPLMKRSHEMAYLAQRADVNWDFPMTVRGLVELGRYPLIGPWRRFGQEDRQAVDQAMETMRIGDLARRQVGALSGGQQQRVLIARALAQEAHVLLLDEPFAGLDQPAQALLARLLKTLAASGRLIVASHHELNTVGDIFDEIVLINGTLIAQGTNEKTMTSANLKQAFGRRE